MACERIFIETHIIALKVDVLQERKIYCPRFFQPGSFTGWGSERVMGMYECVYVFYIALRYCIIITLLYCIMSGA